MTRLIADLAIATHYYMLALKTELVIIRLHYAQEALEKGFYFD